MQYPSHARQSPWWSCDRGFRNEKVRSRNPRRANRDPNHVSRSDAILATRMIPKLLKRNPLGRPATGLL